jgi:hypothetical protein
MLTPSVKGAIAELAIAAEAVKAGIFVLRPVAEADATTSCSISACRSCVSSASGRGVAVT